MHIHLINVNHNRNIPASEYLLGMRVGRSIRPVREKRKYFDESMQLLGIEHLQVSV